MSLNNDIQRLVIKNHTSLGFPGSHAETLHLFNNSVIAPSLENILQGIKENARNHEPEDLFFNDDLANIFQSTVEGYLLTIQSLWERGLRNLLITREWGECAGPKVEKLQDAKWYDGGGSLQSHFERLLLVPITVFDSYDDLNLLQNLANAIRHGNGSSAERVYAMAPSLWHGSGWIAPAQTIQCGSHEITGAAGVAKYPSFNMVKLDHIVLAQMVQSVINFWNDLEFIRLNSFLNKHESVVRRLAAWPEERRLRPMMRVWEPNSGRIGKTEKIGR